MKWEHRDDERYCGEHLYLVAEPFDLILYIDGYQWILALLTPLQRHCGCAIELKHAMELLGDQAQEAVWMYRKARVREEQGLRDRLKQALKWLDDGDSEMTNHLVDDMPVEDLRAYTLEHMDRELADAAD